MQFTFVLKTNFLLKPLKKDAVKSLVFRKAKQPMLRDCQPPKTAIRAVSAELLFRGISVPSSTKLQMLTTTVKIVPLFSAFTSFLGLLLNRQAHGTRKLLAVAGRWFSSMLQEVSKRLLYWERKMDTGTNLVLLYPQKFLETSSAFWRPWYASSLALWSPGLILCQTVWYQKRSASEDKHLIATIHEGFQNSAHSLS